jgi:hypothetical protein
VVEAGVEDLLVCDVVCLHTNFADLLSPALMGLLANIVEVPAGNLLLKVVGCGVGAYGGDACLDQNDLVGVCREVQDTLQVLTANGCRASGGFLVVLLEDDAIGSL